MAAAMALDDRRCMQTIPSDPVIRPIARTDRKRLAEAFSALSQDTRRRRFGGLANRLGVRDINRLTDIDHHEHEALVAIAPSSDAIVGVARYIALPDDPGAAEVAIAVNDDCQGRGVGRRLMRRLAERAREEGITRLLAYVGVANHPALGWLRRAGGVAVGHDGGAVVVSIPLDHSAEGRRAA
jgi:ribosomal protein S18 acetylase RimI-like enzyme